jgi:hypothetical protein
MTLRRGAAALLTLLITGCATAPAPSTRTPTAGSVPALAAAIAADAARSDRESDSKVRAELAATALSDADACLVLEPKAAACLYGRAVALGLEARAHPTRAGDSLNKMLEDLASAEAADPNYDHAGPARVRALVLIRAPGWPLGPGDPAAGLIAARRAVSLQGQYPPNLLALAEALDKTGDANAARQVYLRARDAAQTLPAGTDRDDWLRQANAGLQPK